MIMEPARPLSRNKKIALALFAIVVVLGVLALIGRGFVRTSQQEDDISRTQELPSRPEGPYVSATDWPPARQILSESFSCLEAGKETERAGGTELRTINGRTYCVTKVSEGAAGSTYTQYAYAFAMPPGDEEPRTEILTFSIRFVQCGNYDESEQGACRAAQATFNPDALADAYAQADSF